MSIFAFPDPAFDDATDAFRAFTGTRVLVTGATGFIGRWTWRLLVACGAEVHALGRSRARLEAVPLAGRHLVADLATPGSLAQVIEALRPEVVFSLAGYGVDPAERVAALDRRLNTGVPVEAAVALAELFGGCPWSGQRLVHAGSAFEVGPVEGRVREDTPPHPQTRYARDKLDATCRIARVRRATRLPAVTARLFTVYGPGEHPHRLLPTLVRAAAAGTPVQLSAGTQARDFTFVGDVAEGLLRLAAAPWAPPVLNLATGTPTRVRDFAHAFADRVDMDPSLLRFGGAAPGEVWQGPADITLLKETLGWAPTTTVQAGIAASVEPAPARGAPA